MSQEIVFRSLQNPKNQNKYTLSGSSGFSSAPNLTRNNRTSEHFKKNTKKVKTPITVKFYFKRCPKMN